MNKLRKNHWAIKHDQSKTSEYNIWRQMRQRCNNPTAYYYKFYGARGIRVCGRWDNNFANFINDMGRKPTNKHTLDRINNDGNYEPDNCRWATRKEQASHRRPSRPLTTMNGKSQSLKKWAEELGINYTTVTMRRSRGWSKERSLSTTDHRYKI